MMTSSEKKHIKEDTEYPKILKVGVIGCGDIFLSHSQAYPDHLHAVLVGFYDRMHTRAENWLNRMSRYMGYVKEAAEELEDEEDKILLEKCSIFEAEAKVYKSVEDLLENVDAIDICTPNNAHIPYSIWALKKGISVMSEKPPARCSYETQMLLDLLSKNRSNPNNVQAMQGSYYQLNENFLWHTSVRELNRLIWEEDIIGTPEKMCTKLGHGGPSWGWNNHFLNPSLSGGGCLSDMGVHAIGQGYGAIGREYIPQNIQSQSMVTGTTPERTLKDSDGMNEYYLQKFMVEDHASIKVWMNHPDLEKDVEWEIESSWAKTMNTFEIFGEKGSLKLGKDDKKRPIIIFTPNGGNKDSQEFYDIPPQGRDSHQLEIVDFFNRI